MVCTFDLSFPDVFLGLFFAMEVDWFIDLNYLILSCSILCAAWCFLYFFKKIDGFFGVAMEQMLILVKVGLNKKSFILVQLHQRYIVTSN